MLLYILKPGRLPQACLKKIKFIVKCLLSLDYQKRKSETVEIKKEVKLCLAYCYAYADPLFFAFKVKINTFSRRGRRNTFSLRNDLYKTVE